MMTTETHLADDRRYFAHYDSSTGAPVTKPFSSMKDVIDWEPGFDRGSAATAPLRQSGRCISGRKTLLCHDMRGGYLEDRFIQGVNVDDCYRFYYWSRIDIFVYFSHHFVTIPTVAWTNAAHTNGVPVLGTVITEWNDGKALCKEFLETEQKRREFITKLVDIAAFHRFEGWLINIENEIPVDDMPSLMVFVKELTDAMHSRLPGSLVIWYDSVIASGILEWQNELNDLNREFFDACDGIFLNYTWKDENLEHSVEAARPRCQDVYVGVDVFGRGCKGGGGFNTIEALQDVRAHDLSVAIFAPGWVYEKLGKSDFVENERHFWDLLKPRCAEHIITTLPLCTTFCQGWGMRYFIDGQVLGRQPWTNMAVQAVQPSGPENGLSYDPTVSYCGGGCLKVQSKDDMDNIREYKMFDTDITLEANRLHYVSLTYKADSETPGIALKFRLFPVEDTETENEYFFVRDSTNSSIPVQGPNTLVCTTSDADRLKRQYGNPTGIPSTSEWVTDWFEMSPTTTEKLKSVSIVLTSEKICPVNIGSFRLFAASDQTQTARRQVENLHVVDVVSRKVTEAGAPMTESDLTLVWNCGPEAEHFVVYCQTSADEDWEFVGVTALTAYHIARLRTKTAVSRFRVQAVYNGGSHTSTESAPIVTVLLE